MSVKLTSKSSARVQEQEVYPFLSLFELVVSLIVAALLFYSSKLPFISESLLHAKVWEMFVHPQKVWATFSFVILLGQ